MDYMSGFVFLMDDFVRGVRVKLRPSDEQKALFNQNFGCCRKAHNEVLARYTTLHGEDYSKVPTKSELNKLLMEAKAEFSYLSDVESTSLQQAVYDLQPAFRNYIKSKRHKPPKFHTKRKDKLCFRQTLRKDKKLVKGNIVDLRVYGEVEIRTSQFYIDLLNRDDIKFNNVTVSSDGLYYYATFNVEGGIMPEQLHLTGKHIGCDINSNINGWLVTSNGQKEFFDITHEIQVIKTINQLMAKCRQKSRKWKYFHRRLIKWYNKRTNKLRDYIENYPTTWSRNTTP